MTRWRTGGLILLAAAGLLAVAWLVSPLPGPPLYDSIGLPSEPYRYLQPPPGTKEPRRAPTSGSLTLSISGQTLPLEEVATNENPPQAQLFLEGGALRVPPGVSRVTLAIRPIPPPAQPQNSTIDGNAYSFTASADNGARLTLESGKASVELRATSMLVTPTVAQFVGERWVPLQTRRFLGTAIFSADVNTLGDFALLLPGRAAKPASSNGIFTVPIIAALAAVLVVVALLLALLVRRQTTRA
jgi:hypothetical protein